jgi:ABC-type bacteriocin/lantibiotic exporter with double-glycine peptidase domain
MSYINRYFLVLGKRSNKLPLMIAIFILNSFIEILGLSLMIPLLYLLIDINTFNEKFYFLNYFEFYKNTLFEYKLLFIGSCILIVYYVKSIFSYLIMKMIASFSYGSQAQLISELILGYQNLPYHKKIDINDANFFNIISNHVRIYTEQTLIGSLRLISETVLVLTIISYLAINDPIAVVLLIGFFSIVALIYFFYMKNFFAIYGKKFSNATENILATIGEIIGSFKEIKILGREKFFNKKINKAASDMSNYGGKAVAYTQMTKYVLESAIITFMIILTAYEVIVRDNTADGVIFLGIFSIAAIRMLPSTFQIITCISGLKLSTHFLEKIHSLIILFKDSNLKIENIKGTILEKEMFRSFEIKSINFHYNNKKSIFNELSLNIKKGDFIGIFGDSGSGKTTLIDLILGLLKPDNNKSNESGIFINGEKLENNLKYWYSKVAYIPQKIFLMNDTIAKNITISDDDSVDHISLQHAIKSSQLHTLIDNLPEGINYNVGDDGNKLSGGQRQRIVLARALYHQRDIIIFDEATASLDNQTEKMIMDEITLLKGKKTILMVTHNIDLLKNTDFNIHVTDNNIEIKK